MWKSYRVANITKLVEMIFNIRFEYHGYINCLLDSITGSNHFVLLFGERNIVIFFFWYDHLQNLSVLTRICLSSVFVFFFLFFLFIYWGGEKFFSIFNHCSFNGKNTKMSFQVVNTTNYLFLTIQ